MAITHTFKGSKGNNGYGYFAFIKDGELCIGESWPNEGGITYQGNYAEAYRALRTLEKEAPTLYNSIRKYYDQHPEKINKTMLMNLEPGTKFKREDDDEKYMLIDFDVSKCFVYGEKLQGFVSALGLTNYKVFLFDKCTTVEIIE